MQTSLPPQITPYRPLCRPHSQLRSPYVVNSFPSGHLCPSIQCQAQHRIRCRGHGDRESQPVAHPCCLELHRQALVTARPLMSHVAPGQPPPSPPQLPISSPVRQGDLDPAYQLAEGKGLGKGTPSVLRLSGSEQWPPSVSLIPQRWGREARAEVRTRHPHGGSSGVGRTQTWDRAKMGRADTDAWRSLGPGPRIREWGRMRALPHRFPPPPTQPTWPGQGAGCEQ